MRSLTPFSFKYKYNKVKSELLLYRLPIFRTLVYYIFTRKPLFSRFRTPLLAFAGTSVGGDPLDTRDRPVATEKGR